MIALLIVLAQTPTTANLPATGIALDVLRPHYRGSAETSLFSVAAYASGRTTIGSMHLYVELPFAHVDVPFAGPNSTLGNPYLGVELGGETGLSWAAGARFPLVPETSGAGVLGLYSDLSRIEAFRFNTATFRGGIRYRIHNADGFTFDAGGGPALWVPTKGAEDVELVLHHHMSAGYRGSLVWFAAGFSGWTWLTQGDGGVGDRTYDEVNVSIGGARGSVRPALHLILPIDKEYNSTVGYVIGFGVAFPLAH
jgi:hypothetical protein